MTPAENNAATVKIMAAMIDEAVASKTGPEPSRHGLPAELLNDLTDSLFDEEPVASAAAEGALVLIAASLQAGRVLDLTGGRIPGDRTNSERLSEHLGRYHIPHTQGALQSSTYRGGYNAKQARNPALWAFCQWASRPERTLADLRAMALVLAHRFAQLELAFPDLPNLNVRAFTFLSTRTLIESLLTVASQGAFEQYLVAAFTHQEVAGFHPAWRAHTKSVKAPDAGRVAADVQVMRRSVLVHALEVSAADWESKLRQAVATARSSQVSAITVVAKAGRRDTSELVEAFARAGVPDGLDVSVVSLIDYLDAVSARLSPAERAASIRQLYNWLVLWGRTRPDLVQQLVTIVGELGLDSEVEEAVEPSVMESAAKLRALADLDDDPVVEVAREDLVTVISWIEAEG